MKITSCFIQLFILGLFLSCKNDSEDINANLARLNNKSWQLSRIIDSLENANGKIYTNIFPENISNNEKLDLLEKYIKKSESNRLAWIQFQERDLLIDSLNNYRATLLDTINIYVDKYSKLHPEEKIQALK
jgi:hypothetical protein